MSRLPSSQIWIPVRPGFDHRYRLRGFSFVEELEASAFPFDTTLEVIAVPFDTTLEVLELPVGLVTDVTVGFGFDFPLIWAGFCGVFTSLVCGAGSRGISATGGATGGLPGPMMVRRLILIGTFRMVLNVILPVG